MRGRYALLCGLTACSALVVRPALAQGPPLGFVTKLGIDVDVRSGGRILADDVAAGTVILEDAAPSPTDGSTVPQVQLRGNNVQVNGP